MLAYVFWHWPRAEVPTADYESLQRRFHAALGADPPPGFLGSRALSIAGAAWAAGGGLAYEDWYLLEGSAALDPLNQAAITASRQRAHDAAAAAAENGTAGLYRLRHGSSAVTATAGAAPVTATWFAKPAGWTYSAFFTLLAPLVDESGAALWGRQMTLGPTPEFCLHTIHPVPLPAPLAGTVLRWRPVWP